jgi:hypothetical protein
MVLAPLILAGIAFRTARSDSTRALDAAHESVIAARPPVRRTIAVVLRDYADEAALVGVVGVPAVSATLPDGASYAQVIVALSDIPGTRYPKRVPVAITIM